MPTLRTIAPAVEPIDLARAKRHLREDHEDPAVDEDIEALITAARTDCESRLQRTLIKSTWRHTLDAFPASGVIYLPMGRVLSVTSVQYLDETGTLQTWSSSLYRVDTDSEPARLTPAPDQSWPATQAATGAVRVTYTAGYLDSTVAADLRLAVPMPIKQWILLALTDLYEQRARSSDRPALAQGFADGLLDPYRIYGA